MHITGYPFQKTLNRFCWWAGWDPRYVRYRYSKALKEGLIKFKRKHFLWHEYHKLFERLKLVEEKERKELRRQLENKRKQIMMLIMSTLIMEC